MNSENRKLLFNRRHIKSINKPQNGRKYSQYTQFTIICTKIYEELLQLISKKKNSHF